MRHDRRPVPPGPRVLRTALAVLGLLAAGGPVAAQPTLSGLPAPRLSSVSPAGGQVGTTFAVTFTGEDLDEPQGLLFSHPGIRAEPVVPPAPPADPKKPAAKPGCLRLNWSKGFIAAQ